MDEPARNNLSTAADKQAASEIVLPEPASTVANDRAQARQDKPDYRLRVQSICNVSGAGPGRRFEMRFHGIEGQVLVPGDIFASAISSQTASQLVKQFRLRETVDKLGDGNKLRLKMEQKAPAARTTALSRSSRSNQASDAEWKRTSLNKLKSLRQRKAERPPTRD